MADTTKTDKAPSVKYHLGVAFEIGGKEIALDPSTALNEIKYKGMECALPNRVPLGDVRNIFDSVLDDLGVDFTWGQIEEETKDIPIINKMTDLLGDAGLAIEEFRLKLPPSHKQGKDGNPVALSETEKGLTRFTVGMSMIWDTQGVEGEKEGKLFGNVYLKGLYFKVIK
uniref:Uncharacterized protein n=1 Tax=Candidatus Kentrum sp. FW TaxID=2126338 RepID=A0A450SGE6_9GAMM|nr:MAG: hypothetical protein BECKFW1821A_GA0114235_102410 [Candidatus Kentron sp. FW]VFJ52109.1 MAG: hypothetical protein BECKFW1821B_GA0114236_101129 [Candidatus Kentron sp. FW]